MSDAGTPSGLPLSTMSAAGAAPGRPVTGPGLASIVRPSGTTPSDLMRPTEVGVTWAPEKGI